MEILNGFGLTFITLIMIPNILFALRHKDAFANKPFPKVIEFLEQAGRFGCIAFMIFNIPGTYRGWGSDQAFAVYLIADILLIALYWAAWFFCRRQNSVFRALALSILPSAVFLLSGILCRSLLLLLSALLFAPAHIFISYKNAS